MKTQENSKPQNSDLLQKLESASKDLLYISETDAPLTPFFWPDDSKKLSAKVVFKNARLPEGTPLTEQPLDEFFESVATAEEWMNEEEKAEVQRFQDLKATLESELENISVFRAGEITIDVFIVGHTEGGFAGVQTKVVET